MVFPLLLCLDIEIQSKYKNPNKRCRFINQEKPLTKLNKLLNFASLRLGELLFLAKVQRRIGIYKN